MGDLHNDNLDQDLAKVCVVYSLRRGPFKNTHTRRRWGRLLKSEQKPTGEVVQTFILKK